MSVMPLCAFYHSPTDAEREQLAINDPEVVLGCEREQGEGPLFFFVPVPGGAVRVGVCQEHADWLKAQEWSTASRRQEEET